MTQAPSGRWSTRRSFFVLTFLVFVIYNSNCRWNLSRDSIPTRVLPFSLLLDGHLYLDDWVEPYLQGQFAEGAYFVAPARGHLYSPYPLIEPLAITPLYALPALWLWEQRPPLAKGGFELTFIVYTMEKLSASLIAALSAGVLFLALKKMVSPGAALALTLVYALASNTWAISSQTLWRQGFTELSFAMLLWALLRDPAACSGALRAPSGGPFQGRLRPPPQLLVGLALALAAANKPAYAILVVLFFLYFARSQGKKLLVFSAPPAFLGALVLFYNVHYFGKLLGAYPSPFSHAPASSPLSRSRFPWWDGFLGLLVSPNRGLLVYMPWTAFSFWGAARVWKQNLFGWGRYLLLGMLAVYALHAGFGLWWGGGVYGPRYLSDLLPFFALLLVPVWPRIRISRPITVLFVATALFSVWAQVVGAYFYPNGYWDSTPASLEVDPSRIWSWRDMQMVRTWKAGPARPDILYEAPLFAQAVLFESAKPYVRLAIIGPSGNRSPRLFEEIRKEPAAQLVAIADSDKALLQAHCSGALGAPDGGPFQGRLRPPLPPAVKCFDDYRTMLDEVKPDAVYVETANARLEIVRECAKRRIDVVVESPMAASAAEAREMESMASAAHLKLMVNYESVWRAASQDFYGRIQGSAVGPVQKITVLDGAQGGAEGGSEALAAGAADWAVWLKGRPSAVFACCSGALRVPDGGPFQGGLRPPLQPAANAGENDKVMVLEYPDASATLHVSYNWPHRDRQVEVFGPKGSLLATDNAVFYRRADTPEVSENPRGQSVELGLLLHETSSAIAYFVYHIQHQQSIEDPVSARMSVEVAEVLDAAKESIRTGRVVALAGE